jgi:hypothetical protein
MHKIAASITIDRLRTCRSGKHTQLRYLSCILVSGCNCKLGTSADQKICLLVPYPANCSPHYRRSACNPLPRGQNLDQVVSRKLTKFSTESSFETSCSRTWSHANVVAEYTHDDVLSDQLAFPLGEWQHPYRRKEMGPIATRRNRITSLETTHKRHLAYSHLTRFVRNRYVITTVKGSIESISTAVLVTYDQIHGRALSVTIDFERSEAHVR